MRLKVGTQNTPKTDIEVTRRRQGWFFPNKWFVNSDIKKRRV
jgi:hypothetical protein